MQATEQYFPVVLFIMLYKVVLTFESVNVQLKATEGTLSYGAPAIQMKICQICTVDLAVKHAPHTSKTEPFELYSAARVEPC